MTLVLEHPLPSAISAKTDMPAFTLAAEVTGKLHGRQHTNLFSLLGCNRLG